MGVDVMDGAPSFRYCPTLPKYYIVLDLVLSTSRTGARKEKGAGVSAGGISQALIPVALFVTAGYAVRRALGIELRPVGRVALYVFSPALVFQALVGAKLGVRDWLGIVAFAILMVVAGVMASRLLGRTLRLDAAQQAGLDLVAVFSNSANLGLPVVALSLGAAGLKVAVVYVLTQVVAVNTVGAYLAGRHGVSPGAAWRRMVRLPALWAMAGAGGLDLLHWGVPKPVLAAVSLGAQAYAPTVLLVLGGGLGDWHPGVLRTRLLWMAGALRLVLMPAVAVGLVTVLALSPAAARALVLQAAMPVAVNALILAQEFDAAPRWVGQAVFFSTLGAALTLPLWLSWLGRA